MACCNTIKSGSLKHTIIIERSVKTSDGSGGNTTVWNTHKTLRAKITPLSGRERVYAQRLEANITHRILFRYVADVLSSDRVNFNGRYFQIRTILNLEEANRFLELSCEEGVAQ